MTNATIDALVAGADNSLVVVTTASHGQRAGCLVGFHTQCSIEPFRYAVWLSKANHTYRVSLFATHFAVHFVSKQHDRLAKLFGTTTGDAVDKFASCHSTLGPGDVPLLADVPAIVFVRETMWDDGSDHVCLVGTPVAVSGLSAVSADHPDVPLRLSDARVFNAGHDAEERPVPDLTAMTTERIDELQQTAAEFGHELTPDQILGLEEERQNAAADPEGPGGASGS